MTLDEAYGIAMNEIYLAYRGLPGYNEDVVVCTGDVRGDGKWEIYFCIWDDDICEVTIWDDGDIDTHFP